jgi:NAD-dependent dihydropyrimidine dehydrogenase PreA subunit
VGFPIPTLCHMDGLAEYGGCRLCVVEIGEEPRSKLVASCTYQVQEGLKVRTNSERVERARRLLMELYVATCPDSKRLQDLAAQMGVRRCRYEMKHEHCIQCGLCVRICREQMMAGAIGFAGRGKARHVSRPFDVTDPACRQCGACLWACPVCELRCQASTATTALCSGCLNFAPVCLQSYDDAMCFLDPCHACEQGGPFRSEVGLKVFRRPISVNIGQRWGASGPSAHAAAGVTVGQLADKVPK